MPESQHIIKQLEELISASLYGRELEVLDKLGGESGIMKLLKCDKTLGTSLKLERPKISKPQKISGTPLIPLMSCWSFLILSGLRFLTSENFDDNRRESIVIGILGIISFISALRQIISKNTMNKTQNEQSGD